jgi:chromosome partitioning protein
MAMIRRVVFNQKGGVGKTTIVCNLAAITAAQGARVLVIDLDTQANTTQYLLGRRAEGGEATIADFFETTLGFSIQSAPLAGYAIATPYDNLELIASDMRLDDLQVKLETKQKVRKLAQAVDKLKGYDAIYIDTPPALNFYSRSALIAADRVLIPFDCDEFARQALYTLIQNIEELRSDHNEQLTVEGIVVNQFQSRARMPARIVAELQAEGLPILPQMLSSSVRVKESHEQHTPMIYFDPSHRVTQEFLALADLLA